MCKNADMIYINTAVSCYSWHIIKNETQCINKNRKCGRERETFPPTVQ